MKEFEIYEDIAKRTDGDIYIGVVGPVRTGKSTFITRFMQELVIPNITDKKKKVAIDELPQSAQGKTVMTTEPKFVPAQAVPLKLDKSTAKIKLIDCVGYLVDEALGQKEDDKFRLVKTPWQEDLMPFDKAAEYGTKKVICDHSTVGVVVTCDGSFTDIPRSSYLDGEERVILELKKLNKPFIVLLNCQNPFSEQAQNIKKSIEEKYNVGVVCNNVTTMTKEDFKQVLESILMEFPLRRIDLNLPKWVATQNPESPLIKKLIATLKEHFDDVGNMRSFEKIENLFIGTEDFEDYSKVNLDTSCGRVSLELKTKPEAYLQAISCECGEDIKSEFELMNYIKELKEAKLYYSKLKGALECAQTTGYGVVNPVFDETELTSPEIVRKMGGYSVKLKAKAKCLHIIRADIETDINPVYGSKAQCDDFVEYISKNDDGKLFEADVFGKPLKDIIAEEVAKNSQALSENMKFKIRRTLTRAINQKKSNLICILI